MAISGPIAIHLRYFLPERLWEFAPSAGTVFRLRSPAGWGDFSQFRVWVRVSTGIDHKFEDLRTGLGPPADLLSGVSESRQRTPPLLPPSLRLRLRATCAVKLLRLCGPTHCVPAALRSDTRPQVGARSCCTLRCSSQPQELAVAGVGTRGNTGCGIASLLNLIAASLFSIWAKGQFRHNSRRPSDPASTRVSAPAARGSGCGHWHRRVPMLRELICGNVFERSSLLRSEFCRTASRTCRRRFARRRSRRDVGCRG